MTNRPKNCKNVFPFDGVLIINIGYNSCTELISKKLYLFTEQINNRITITTTDSFSFLVLYKERVRNKKFL